MPDAFSMASLDIIGPNDIRPPWWRGRLGLG
jgi:hypothetical protein